MSPDLVVTGIGVVSPWADTPAAAVIDGPRRPVNADWFDVKKQLGPRGFKYLPPAAQYLLAAASKALADAGACMSAVDEDRRGALVGTNSAVSALHERMDRTVIEGHADQLSPATAAFFSINLFGSQLSSRHALKGFNVTVTSPRVAGLEAVELGGRALALGRSALLLAGATEAAVEPPAPGVDQAEAGSVVLVIEPSAVAGPRAAEIRGFCRVRTLFVSPRLLREPDGRRRASAAIRGAFGVVCGDPASAPPVHLVVDESPVASVVADALIGPARANGAGSQVTRHPARSGCLEPMLHVARLLVTADQECVLATASAEGNVALAWLSPRRRAGA